MDRSSAGISGRYTRYDNGYNQPNGQVASSNRGRYRHATVRQWNHPPRNAPGRNQFYHSSGTRSYQHLQCRSINSPQDFNALIKPEIMAGLVSKSERFGHRYDGRNHGRYASSIKKYSSAAKRPLNRTEQSQLMRLLQNFTATRSWNWRSLTTTLHSLTSAGVFTPHKPMDEHVQRTQAALLSTLLDAIRFKCNKKAEAWDIDAQGIANLLWAMTKLVDNGQEKTPEFNKAMAALLPHVNTQKAHFKPQEVANLVWAMAKLVDNGQEQTPGLNEAVAALLPLMNAQKNQFNAQGIVNLLWAMAKLVDNGQERTPEFNKALGALLPQVNAQKDWFIPQHIANLLWAMAKLEDNGLEWTPDFNKAVVTLLPHVNAQKDQFSPQHIANLMWAMAKLEYNGQERIPGLNETVAVLLPHVNAQKANFKPQEITNLLWAMAKLVDNRQEQTPEFKKAVAALLPHVNAQKDQLTAQGIANLLQAMAKLVDNGQEQTPEFKKAVAALLPRVNAQKDQFIPQHIANLLWAMAKLVDNGQEQTPGLNEAVAALLPFVNIQKANFNPQEIANLLWAMAKLVDNGLGQTPGLNEAVSALMPLVNGQKANFKPQGIANQLWAMAKLVDNGQEHAPELNEAVVALLPLVNAQKANFKPQEIANLLWAMAKLVDNGQEHTPELNEAVVTLLPLINAQKANFQPQEIANLLWAIAKLGELVELNVVTSTFESLVYRIIKNPQFSQKEISMSLWAVMVCCARLFLGSNANKNNVFEKHMDDLFIRLENTSPDNEEDQSIMIMAASWLGRTCSAVLHYQTIISKNQADFRDQLKSSIPALKIEEEKRLNSLPPVDLLLPDHNVVIEVQGPSHYVGGDFKTRNGSTLLKIALLQKAGFEVIEIPTNQLLKKDLMKPYIDQIKIRMGIPPQEHGFVSYKRAWTDATYVTGEEHLAEQTNPAKKKKTNIQ
ncbi:RAP domain-containing protein [Endozoicomonas acroporae]|uniref:RAP domain-containing protein n=1 Tax=Endozoicomonas acroporae TaxID=1701104 RepID=UPI0013D35AF7|nr:RAP domain-containing protein [Endozoicomonas acroporae]